MKKLLLILFLVPTAASAHEPVSNDKVPAAIASQAAMEKMHENMMITYTAVPDVDFVRGMIPHHQGAIDMAKIELQYGKDPEIRKLAEGIIKAQEAEIKQMMIWLRTNDHDHFLKDQDNK